MRSLLLKRINGNEKPSESEHFHQLQQGGEVFRPRRETRVRLQREVGYPAQALSLLFVECPPRCANFGRTCLGDKYQILNSCREPLSFYTKAMNDVAPINTSKMVQLCYLVWYLGMIEAEKEAILVRTSARRRAFRKTTPLVLAFEAVLAGTGDLFRWPVEAKHLFELELCLRAFLYQHDQNRCCFACEHQGIIGRVSIPRACSSLHRACLKQVSKISETKPSTNDGPICGINATFSFWLPCLNHTPLVCCHLKIPQMVTCGDV